MIRKLIIVLVSCALFACDVVKEADALSQTAETEKIWVFAQFNVPQKDNKFEDYYYYGLMSEPLFKKIKSNELDTGFVLLENIKYWGDDDLIYDYADKEDVGSILFRIEDIRRIRLIKIEPKSGMGSEQFDDELPIVPLNNGTNSQEEILLPSEDTLPTVK